MTLNEAKAIISEYVPKKRELRLKDAIQTVLEIEGRLGQDGVRLVFEEADLSGLKERLINRFGSAEFVV